MRETTEDVSAARGSEAMYLLVVHQLFADLAGVEPIQATVAFSRPAVVLRLEAVVDEAPLDTCATPPVIHESTINPTIR